MDDDISPTTVELRSAVTTAESATPMLINRERARNRRASESEEAREQRLARDRARRRQRLASETADKRGMRRRAQNSPLCLCCFYLSFSLSHVAFLHLLLLSHALAFLLAFVTSPLLVSNSDLTSSISFSQSRASTHMSSSAILTLH